MATTGSKRGSYASPRQQQRQDRILAAARELIAARGYEGLTMRELAQAAAVSDKTLYNLFVSKDGLVMAAVADLLNDIMAQAAAPGQPPGLAAITRYSDAISAQILRSPAYAGAMAQALFQADSASPIVDVLLASNQRFLRRELGRAQRRGEMPAGRDRAADATMLTGHIWGVLLVWNKGLLSLASLPTMSRQSLLTSLTPLVSATGAQLLARWSGSHNNNLDAGDH